MNIVCNSLGHQPTGQPVTTGVPNSEYEERKKGKPRIGQQATGHRPQTTGQEAIGSQYKDRNKGKTQG
jgi:uncharacterized protein YraI